MSRPTPPTYKTRNWPKYNKALKRRASLAIWFDSAMTWEARRAQHGEQRSLLGALGVRALGAEFGSVPEFPAAGALHGA